MTDDKMPVEIEALIKGLISKNASESVKKERNSEGYGLLALVFVAGVLSYFGVITPDRFMEIAQWCVVTYGVVRGGKKAAEAIGNGKK